jgi:DNA-binding transcriptional MerR regulator
MDIHMNEDHTYTLTELAKKTGLTERTVRYYIEQVLPPHHKQGRGKLARYGQDTLNSIRFILLVGKRYGLKPGQAKGVLADVPQETIDRVVRGEEELAVMTVPSAPQKMDFERSGHFPSSTAQVKKYLPQEDRMLKTTENRLSSFTDMETRRPGSEPVVRESAAFSMAEPEYPWQTIFRDERLRIQCRGKRKLSPHQKEQIETAARLIQLALK